MQPSFRRLAFLAIAVIPWLFVSGAHGDETQSAAMQTYDVIQALRQKAGVLIEQQNSEAEIRKGIAVLDDALAIVNRPDTEELGNGNIYLKFRRADVEFDLADAYARLGENAIALDHLEAAARFSSLNGLLDILPKYRSGLHALESEPRYRQLVEQTNAIDRIWKHPAIGTGFSETLSEEQRIAGLSLFWTEANFNFVYFDKIADVDWDQAYLAFLPRVMAAQNTRDYYAVLMQFAPLLRDAHTNIYPPKELAAHFYARPPMSTVLVDGHVLVRAVWSPSLAKSGVHVGDEIMQIDGQPVLDYAAQHVRPYQSIGTPQDGDVRVYGYALLQGDAATPVALTLRDARNIQRVVVVSRGHYDDAHRDDPTFFKDLGNGVVYVDVDEFDDDAMPKAFEKAWPRIQAAKALVIDVRGNGGGSANYGSQILTYLTAKPIPVTQSSERFYQPVKRAHGYPDIEWRTLDARPYPNERTDIFNGKVAVLTDARTFSAAEDFVASFQMLHRGLVVGQRTGGGTGQPLVFTLPGGGTARICAKRDEFPDGHSFVGVGIAPDIEVTPTVADLRANRDPVIERTKKELLRNR